MREYRFCVIGAGPVLLFVPRKIAVFKPFSMYKVLLLHMDVRTITDIQEVDVASDITDIGIIIIKT